MHHANKSFGVVIQQGINVTHSIANTRSLDALTCRRLSDKQERFGQLHFLMPPMTYTGASGK